MAASWWTSGKQGSLSPWSQAMVAAILRLREHKKIDLDYNEIAQEVTKIGGGHPSKQAICLMAALLEKDPAWHPGKDASHAKKRGPKPVFAKRDQSQVAKSAMSLKKRGHRTDDTGNPRTDPKGCNEPSDEATLHGPDDCESSEEAVL